MKNSIILILLLPIVLLSQTNEDSEPRNESYITTDLLSPFFVHYTGNFTPRWRLGYIKYLNGKSKLGVDIGYGNKKSSLINTEAKYSLWEIRPEYYHIIDPNRKTLKYFALELFFINHKEEFINQSFFSDQNEFLAFDKANYNRQKLGIIPKFGMFVNLSKILS